MNQLRVDPTTLTTVASDYVCIADEITSAATGLTLDSAALAAVFGVIGAEFVVAATTTCDRHRERVTGLAEQSHAIASDLRRAGADYRGGDRDAAAALSGTSPTRSGVA